MGFDLSNYEQVKDRITRFYKDHAEGRILTELVTAPAELETRAAFKALVYIGDTLKATGYAFETKGQGVNKEAWVENAETSAIGRALANMDYCGTLRPSREEMEKATGRAELQPQPTHDKVLAWQIRALINTDAFDDGERASYREWESGLVSKTVAERVQALTQKLADVKAAAAEAK